MTWRTTCCHILAGGMLLAAVALPADDTAGQTAPSVHFGSPTYAIPLKDATAAIVWWDAVSDPAHPGWRCEIPTSQEGRAGRTILTLTAADGDWRAALTEARALLKGRAVESQ